jgi:thiol-disulfide isomerase/thioredoxin
MITFIRVLIAFLLIGMAYKTSSAQHALSGTIRTYQNEKLILTQLRGEKQIAVDSVITDSSGAFSMAFKEQHLPGMFVLQTTEGQSIKLIYNNEDIRFVSGGFGDEDVVEFIESPENELWYEYYFLRNSTQYQQELLKPLLVQYPDEGEFFTAVIAEYDRLQNEMHDYVESTRASNPYSLAVRYMQYDLSPKIDLNKSFNEQRAELKKHFFDAIDFNDDALLRSDILNRKFIDYLSMYQQQGQDMAEVQLAFMQAVDVILSESAISPDAYVFAVTFLIEGFSRMGLNAVSDFISGLPHLNPGCMEPETIENLELSIAPYRKIAVGVQAPSISTNDLDGNPFELESLRGKNTLVVFWSTSCPFCIDLLPQLKAYQSDHPQTEIVSIILSPDNNELRNIIKDEKLDWIHISPRESWQSKIVNDYLVYATPTMILLDKDHRIVLKPNNYEELKMLTP